MAQKSRRDHKHQKKCSRGGGSRFVVVGVRKMRSCENTNIRKCVKNESLENIVKLAGQKDSSSFRKTLFRFGRNLTQTAEQVPDESDEGVW